MSPISSVLCAVVLASAVCGDKHMLELKEHYEHLAYIAHYNCHVPQPRVIPVHELFSENERHNKAYFPDVTVLHRCDDASGCCTSGHWCRPVHADKLHLPFKVTFLEDTGKHKKGSWLIDYYYMDNHTECHCVEPPPKPSVCHTHYEPKPHHQEGPGYVQSSGQNQEATGYIQSSGQNQEGTSYLQSSGQLNEVSSTKPIRGVQSEDGQVASSSYIPPYDNAETTSTEDTDGANVVEISSSTTEKDSLSSFFD